MQCAIISSKDKQEFKDITSITLPAFSGEMQILPNHAESFIVLQKGPVVLEGHPTNAVLIEGGICHVKDNTVIVIS